MTRLHLKTLSSTCITVLLVAGTASSAECPVGWADEDLPCGDNPFVVPMLALGATLQEVSSFSTEPIEEPAEDLEEVCETLISVDGSGERCRTMLRHGGPFPLRELSRCVSFTDRKAPKSACDVNSADLFAKPPSARLSALAAAHIFSVETTTNGDLTQRSIQLDHWLADDDRFGVVVLLSAGTVNRAVGGPCDSFTRIGTSKPPSGALQCSYSVGHAAAGTSFWVWSQVLHAVDFREPGPIEAQAALEVSRRTQTRASPIVGGGGRENRTTLKWSVTKNELVLRDATNAKSNEAGFEEVRSNVGRWRIELGRFVRAPRRSSMSPASEPHPR